MISSSSPPRSSNTSLEISPKLLGTPQGQSAAKLIYKPLKEDNDYLIFEDGRVYSKKVNRFLKGKVDNVGYQVYSLNIINPITGKKGKIMYAHRLVAEYFISNPDNLPYVHHKDENKLNNCVLNLEWVNEKQNYQDNIRVVKKPEYFESNFEGEEWKIVIENPMYEVSNKGRVRNRRTNRLLHLDYSQKYVRVGFNDKKHYYVHRLVYCTFYNDYDLDGYVIDHLDSNPKNNNLDNLEKVTHSENNKRRFK